MKRLTKKEKNILAQLIGQEIDSEIMFQLGCNKDFKYANELINTWRKLTQLPMKQQEVLLNNWKEQMQ